MHPILRNILALVAGLVVGSLVNMGIVNISGMIIPPPEGVDVRSMESLSASMHLFSPIHYLMPFLAHALGTFVGAWIAARFAFSHNMKFALGVGCFSCLVGLAPCICCQLRSGLKLLTWFWRTCRWRGSAECWGHRVRWLRVPVIKEII